MGLKCPYDNTESINDYANTYTVTLVNRAAETAAYRL